MDILNPKYKTNIVNIESVRNQGKQRYNSNNHWPDGKRPEDYDYVLSLGHTRHWINGFHSYYMVLNFDMEDIVWLRAAHRIGKITGKFPGTFIQELNEICLKYKNFNLSDRNWFVRSEKCSLKYGQHGPGPYKDIRAIIESLVTSIEGHSPITDDTMELRLYFMPWHDDIYHEFRIFVYKNRITCISQQDVYEVCNIKRDTLMELYDIIIDYYNNVIKQKITHIDSYVIDMAILSDKITPYFIEINSFGKEYASGSALFHWIHDEDILYGKKDIIYCRYTVHINKIEKNTVFCI